MLHQVALFQRLQKRPHQALQCLLQADTGIGYGFGRYVGVATRVGENSPVQPGLVAKVVADGCDVDLCGQRDLAGGRLGIAIFSEQRQSRIEQAVARLGAIAAQRLGRGRGRRIFDHGA